MPVGLIAFCAYNPEMTPPKIIEINFYQYGTRHYFSEYDQLLKTCFSNK